MAQEADILQTPARPTGTPNTSNPILGRKNTFKLPSWVCRVIYELQGGSYWSRHKAHISYVWWTSPKPNKQTEFRAVREEKKANQNTLAPREPFVHKKIYSFVFFLHLLLSDICLVKYHTCSLHMYVRTPIITYVQSMQIHTYVHVYIYIRVRHCWQAAQKTSLCFLEIFERYTIRRRKDNHKVTMERTVHWSFCWL